MELSPVTGAKHRPLIERELELVLSGPAFRHSRRSSQMLQALVQATLEERSDTLRERSLGVELFGRPPGYDTTIDSVVRVAAAEVRRRLQEHYRETTTSTGIRLELPTGGYQPVFHLVPHQPTEASQPINPQPIAAAPSQAPSSLFAPLRLLTALLVVLSVALAAWGIAAWRETPFHRFWRPLLATAQPITIGVGLVDALAPANTSTPFADRVRQECQTLAGCKGLATDVKPIGGGTVPTGDVQGLAGLLLFLGRQSKPALVRPASGNAPSAPDHAAVLSLGYFSNPWTVATIAPLRYRLSYDRELLAVIDATRPDFHEWEVVQCWPTLKNRVDYAIVARLISSGSPRLAIGGFTPYGTEAAARLVVDEAAMNRALEKLDRDWEHKNLEIVIRTTTQSNRDQSNRPSPAEVVAVHAW